MREHVIAALMRHFSVRMRWYSPGVLSAAIRSYQHNFLVGLNRFDRKGVKKGGEFQIYADKSDFTRVAVDARGDRVILVYGEDRQGTGRILFGKVNCAER